MKLYQRLVLICLGGAAMFVASAGGAAFATSQKADYDYYVLALSLAPAFCEDALGKRRVPRQCWNVSLADFQRQPLTLHGLWPSRRSGTQPFYCNGERDQGSMCEQTWPGLPSALFARLKTVMPGTEDCLERHEWAKHGSCSGLDRVAYFEESIKLTERVNRALKQVLVSHAGRDAALESLRAGLEKYDPDLLESVVFDCRTPKSDAPSRRKPMLREVKVYFSVLPDGRPGDPINFRQAGAKHFNSGCPAGQAYVDTP